MSRGVCATQVAIALHNCITRPTQDATKFTAQASPARTRPTVLGRCTPGHERHGDSGAWPVHFLSRTETLTPWAALDALWRAHLLPHRLHGICISGDLCRRAPLQTGRFSHALPFCCARRWMLKGGRVVAPREGHEAQEVRSAVRCTLVCAVPTLA